MSLTLVTPPTLPVTLAEAKVHLREDGADEDALIGALIAAAYSHAEKWTGTTFAPSTWDYVAPAFAARIALPKAPVTSIESITYFDPDDVSQVLTAADYRLDSERGIVTAASAWPAVFDRSDAVTVRFVAGAGVPPEVHTAMLLLIGHWFHNREAVADGASQALPLGVDALLNLHRQQFV